MNAKKITLILIPINIILAFFVYDSISSEVEFNKLAKERIAENVQKLKDLRTLQIAYKRENEVFADNFTSLIDFLENDSTTIIKSIEDLRGSYFFVTNHERLYCCQNARKSEVSLLLKTTNIH